MVEIYVSKYFEHQSIHAVKRVGKMAWKLGIHRKWWSSVLLREERWPQLTRAGVYMDAGELCGNPIYHHTESEHLQCLLYISPVYISLHISDSLKSHLISSEAQGNIQTLWVLCLVYTHTLLLLLNLFYWIITDTQHYIFSGTLLSDSVFLYITPWSPWQV